jgi:hypothetical protein
LSRRVRLPTADDLFRPTAVPDPEDGAGAAEASAERGGSQVVELGTKAGTGRTPPGRPEPRAASGRVRHDEKMTVYVTADELLDLEHARLELRRHHGIAVDRGRLVRAAVALALADLDAHGPDSAIVQRLAEG